MIPARVLLRLVQRRLAILVRTRGLRQRQLGLPGGALAQIDEGSEAGATRHQLIIVALPQNLSAAADGPLACALLSNGRMADGIYVGMSGAVARAEQLDAIADGLANAQTPGFKASRPAFASVLADAQPLRSHVAAVATAVDPRAGLMQTTGNALDITPDGGAFLAVRTPSGEVAYTRDGRITLDNEGRLRVASGLVLGKSGEPITIPAQQVPAIGSDGAVTAEGQEIDRLALFQLAGPLERRGGALYAAPSVEPIEARVQVGTIELGNYTALEAAVGMVTAQRAFEHSMQVIETYKKIGDRSNELGRVK
jgi:flagellar basal-body rod protein FlgF